MNMLLLRENEIASGCAVITGPRAVHIHSVLHAKQGDRLKAGLFQGKLGTVRIVSVEKNKVVVDDPVFDRMPPEPLPIILAVALPRPQTFKKTLHFIASSGIKKAIFFHSMRVEKSYWNSSVLTPEALRAELDEGLEQGVDTIAPELIFCRSFADFLTYSAENFGAETAKIVAHPVPEGPAVPKTAERILLAIGPEGGFLPREVETLVQAGFQKCGFGAHILRVEFACSFIAGCLQNYFSNPVE